MRLDSARDLKQEILATLPSFVPRADDEMPAIAVGVAPTADSSDYKIAIRARSDKELPSAARRYLERATIGELDVRVIGPVTAYAARLAIGASTAHARGRLGTLGCFARRNNDGSVGFVSNNHVIAAEDAGQDGDEVLSLINGSERVVGRLAGDYPRLMNGPQLVDCAFAHLVEGIDFDPATIGDGEALLPTPVDPTGLIVVRKVGRTTGRTDGRITAFTLTDVVVDYSFGQVLFHEQIEIESLTQQPFSAPGDSGSIIFTADRHPVALLHAGSAIGGFTNAGLTYANPVSAVLEILGISLLA